MALRKQTFSKPQLLIFTLVFALIGGILIYRSFAASNPNLPGDVNNDNVVDITDLSTILTYFNTTDSRGDADSSGRVDITDLSIVLSHYGGSYSPPPSGLPFPEASLKPGYQTLPPVPATQLSVTCPLGNDCLIDLQNIKRTDSLLIYGYSNSNIKVVNGYWEITKPRGAGSAYGYGGPRIRSLDGLGPANVSLTNMRITGTTLEDGIAIDASVNTKVTIQRTRIEYLTLNSAELTEHIDAIQVQGPIGQLNVGLSTLGLAGVNSANDPGKGLMLKKETSAARPFTVNLKSVNFLAKGGTGANIFQDTRDITVNLDNNVWVYKSDTAGCVWSSNSCIFYPDSDLGANYSWYSTGTAPNRIADWPDASGIFGQAREGMPPNGNFAP
ncbi:hypothetical protein KW803_00930 [Candidatus Saccharibacteria bacterium]|nr:hypothetical protein [Candidatus Saccharibacteria bacterium]